MVALLPCCAAAIYYYGIRALILLLWGATLFAFSDHFFTKYFRNENSGFDVSSIVSGTILVLLLPPTVSIWTLSAGVLFSSIIVKQVFGGPGANIFNPALAGRAFLAIAFSAQTSTYTAPLTGRLTGESLFIGPVDAIDTISTVGESISHSLLEVLSGAFPGAMGITGAIFALMGGLYLVTRGLLKLHAPIAYVLTIIAGYWLFFLGRASLPDLASLLIMSGISFCAVFSLGDYSTTPTSRTGRVIFGIGAGVLALLFFAFGNSLFAIVFPVLVMNGVTPILDFYIRPRIFANKGWYYNEDNPPTQETSETEVEA
jgi:Na+-translocating ferredoxin:NAD+ oxidoreductase RnfD subunit